MKKALKKLTLLSLLLYIFIYILNINTFQTFAQNTKPLIEAKIISRSVVEVDKNIIVDGTQSIFPEGKQVRYKWDLGDGNTSIEEEVVHVYKKPGKHSINLEIKVDGVTHSVSKDIFVYTKILSLINDNEQRNIRIQGLKNLAEESGVFLKDLSLFSSFTKRKELLDRIIEEKELLKNTKSIMFWVDDIRLLGLLSDIQGEQKSLLNLEDKTIIIISQLSLNNIVNIIKNNLSDNFPKQIILTRPEAVDEVVLIDTEFLPGILRERGYDVEVVTGNRLTNTSPLNIVSKTINDARKQGFPDDFVLLFLLLPLIILIINIGKNLFGVTTTNIGVPILLTITFYSIGLLYGVMLFSILYFTSLILKNILRKYHLLPISKSAINITIITLILFFTLLSLSSHQLVDFQRAPIYPFVVLAFFLERTINIEKRNILRSIMVFVEMLFISFIAYSVITITALQVVFLSYPEIIILILLLNIPIGRYTGLTVKEYVRFKDIIFKEE